jgi:6-phospho-3-hexuloisomerase
VTSRLLTAVDDLVRVLKGVKTRELKAFEDAILASNRIFVTGLGRTGLMARGFAMRLMHLGRRVYHVGDVITPAIRRGDLLVLCSRTGRSKVLSHYIDMARKARVQVAIVTGSPRSTAARSADVVVAIDDTRVMDSRRRRREPYLPLGSLYEQALLLVLDQVVVDLMERLGLNERDLARIHATLE